VFGACPIGDEVIYSYPSGLDWCVDSETYEEEEEMLRR